MDEDELVRLIARHAGGVAPGDVGIGDDAAVVGDTAVCHDMLVQDVHFRWTWTSPADLGHKALAVNLSDLAAMGASPTAAVVGLAMGPGPLAEPGAVAAMYDAMAALAAACGCAIVGGDTSASAVTVVGVTALGRLPASGAVRRGGARAGDALCVTGSVGAAAAGLAVREGHAPAGLDPDGNLETALLRPTPRVAEGIALAKAGVHAMIDCSDGLARDAGRLAAASGLGVTLDLDAVPLAPGVAGVARALGRDPAAFAASGGEDYELIVALPGDAPAPDGVPLVRVGTLTAEPGVRAQPAGRLDPAHLGWRHRVGDA
ncbi:MAG: thiamine-phosphate kinase [Thermoleophilia bacterium]|nr:thiamine-phosphate kinase [Thermoleophilia bacterium]